MEALKIEPGLNSGVLMSECHRLLVKLVSERAAQSRHGVWGGAGARLGGGTLPLGSPLPPGLPCRPCLSEPQSKQSGFHLFPFQHPAADSVEHYVSLHSVSVWFCGEQGASSELSFEITMGPLCSTHHR